MIAPTSTFQIKFVEHPKNDKQPTKLLKMKDERYEELPFYHFCAPGRRIVFLSERNLRDEWLFHTFLSHVSGVTAPPLPEETEKEKELNKNATLQHQGAAIPRDWINQAGRRIFLGLSPGPSGAFPKDRLVMLDVIVRSMPGNTLAEQLTNFKRIPVVVKDKFNWLHEIPCSDVQYPLTLFCAPREKVQEGQLRAIHLIWILTIRTSETTVRFLQDGKSRNFWLKETTGAKNFNTFPVKRCIDSLKDFTVLLGVIHTIASQMDSWLPKQPATSA